MWKRWHAGIQRGSPKALDAVDRLLSKLAEPDRKKPPLEQHRWVEVLRLSSHGLTRKRVAREMGIGEETVKTHLQRAAVALGANNTTHAVAIAWRKGLIE